ncbi:MAG: hypothetical protein DRJ03_31295 [Chloroflexi bacterium]|nr:MAG: hypothetical protein DRJ03_31295 [Chloroflexota bacterium]
MKDLLAEFPTQRLKPVDGLAVTAEIWEEAHEYHRQQQRFHALLGHGAGIVTGLDVIASDPPDTSVYIQPGVAVDQRGEAIILTEPLTYDIGNAAAGQLYLLLSYGESYPLNDDQTEGPRYVHAEFGIEVQPSLSGGSGVELARIRRQDRESPIFDAQDPAHPGPNEIDLRFRRDVGAAPVEHLGLAVVYVGGGVKSVRHGQGASYMARAFSRHKLRGRDYRLHVDYDISLTADLAVYTLVYLVGQGAFQLGKEEMESLYAYMQGGGVLFIESCRHEVPDGEPPADTSFYNLLSDLGVKLNELRPDHRLLVEPFLFAAPPPGFETQGVPRVAVSDEVIMSTYDYGCLWQGERRGGSASREEIRAAMEWGSNVVAYALERRQRSGQ